MGFIIALRYKWRNANMKATMMSSMMIIKMTPGFSTIQMKKLKSISCTIICKVTQNRAIVS